MHEMEQIDIDLLVPSSLRVGALPILSGAEISLAKSRGLNAFPPVLVRVGEGGNREILSGIRVWLLAQKIGESQVTAITKAIDDTQAAQLVADDIAGHQNPIALAMALRDVVMRCRVSKAEAGRRFGLQRSTVSNLLRILDLAPEVVRLIQNGAITQGHAKPLHGLSPDRQVDIVNQIIRDGLSVRQAEQLAKKGKGEGPGSVAPPLPTQSEPKADPVLLKMQEDLSKIIGSPVSIHQQDTGLRLCVDCHNLDALDGVLQKLGYRQDEFDG